MRIKRMARSVAVAGSLAMLSLLSMASTILACTGGGDFPLRR